MSQAHHLSFQLGSLRVATCSAMAASFAGTRTIRMVPFPRRELPSPNSKSTGKPGVKGQLNLLVYRKAIDSPSDHEYFARVPSPFLGFLVPARPSSLCDVVVSLSASATLRT